MQNLARIKFGSHLYGTATPQSDLDYKSVHLPDAKDILLQRVEPSVKAEMRRKADGEKNSPDDVDDQSYSLQKFLELVAQGQTVAIDMLFAPAACIESRSTIWNYIMLHRDRLLSKKSAAFLGYCRQQANKYGIKGSRVDAAKKASEIFSNALEVSPYLTVGSFDRALNELASTCPEHVKVLYKKTLPTRYEAYFSCCDKQVPFNASVKHAAEIYTRIYKNYRDRARQAQSNEGIDWKALSHAVRVGHEAIELLNTGRITFPLPNAAHILDIKQGNLPYTQVAEEIEHMLAVVEKSSETSSLPAEPDYEFIESIVERAYGSVVSEARG